MMKQIALLGSTGSVGKTTLRAAEHLGIQVVALAARHHSALLEEQIRRFHPEVVALFDREAAVSLRNVFPHLRILEGEEGVCEVASLPQIEGVVVAMVGMAALAPTLAAIEASKTIALSTKEVIVSAGAFIMEQVRRRGISLIPIDSEHSAIFQCLRGHPHNEIRRILLTASGGPFLHKSAEQLDEVSCEQALCHPTWRMGAKNTIDSSTLMNKALEVIEAHHLFNLPVEQIEVVIHPQSVIHCLVEWVDGNLFAQCHPTDMIYPVQYALTYPERAPSPLPPFDFTKYTTLEFVPPDRTRFPALDYAEQALRVGKSMPCYLNASNEVLVERFLKGRITWKEISKKLELLLQRHRPLPQHSLEEVLEVDKQARQEALAI